MAGTRLVFQSASYELLFAIAVSLLVLLALLLVKVLLLRQLRWLTSRGRLRFLSYPQQIVKATRLPLLFGVAFLAGMSQFDFSARQEKWLHYAWVVILVTQMAMWGNRLLTVAVQRAYDAQCAINPAGATHLTITGLVTRIALWTVAILIMLDNFGFNVRTLMASVGIGGIAVALAAQNVLGDLFSSVSIALGKPFVLGADLYQSIVYATLYSSTLWNVDYQSPKQPSDWASHRRRFNDGIVRASCRPVAGHPQTAGGTTPM